MAHYATTEQKLRCANDSDEGAIMEEAVANMNTSTLETPIVSRNQMPLSFLRVGERAKIAKVRGKGDLHHHLENLGFVENADVVIVNDNGGNIIVEVKCCQVALDKQVASKIITK